MARDCPQQYGSKGAGSHQSRLVVQPVVGGGGKGSAIVGGGGGRPSAIVGGGPRRTIEEPRAPPKAGPLAGSHGSILLKAQAPPVVPNAQEQVVPKAREPLTKAPPPIVKRDPRQETDEWKQWWRAFGEADQLAVDCLRKLEEANQVYQKARDEYAKADEYRHKIHKEEPAPRYKPMEEAKRPRARTPATRIQGVSQTSRGAR